MLASDAAVTLLSVCPNSEAVARGALLAAQRADAPMMFAATLNQVDVAGGYTGWAPSDFAAYLDESSSALGIAVPVLDDFFVE